MSEYYPNDSNVDMGMVPCKKGCRCPDCTIDRLQARIDELELENKDIRSEWYKCAKELERDLKLEKSWQEAEYATRAKLQARITELENEVDLRGKILAEYAQIEAERDALKSQIDELEEEKQHIEDGWTAFVEIMLEPEIETLQAKIKRYETKLLTLGYLIEDE